MLIPRLTGQLRSAALIAGALVAAGASVGLANELPQSLNPGVRSAPVVPPAQAPKVVPPVAVAPVSPILVGGNRDESAADPDGCTSATSAAAHRAGRNERGKGREKHKANKAASCTRAAESDENDTENPSDDD